MLKYLLVLGGSLILFSSSLLAAGFQLKAIGALDVTGTMSSEWWYTSANPVLSGTADPESEVTVTINGQEYQVTADGLGSWSYVPEGLTEGSHEISLTAAAGSQSFTLNIGPVPADVSAPAQQSQPVAGSTEQTMWLFLGAGLILAAGVAILPVKS